jgi:hypothetical protein
MLSFMVKLQVLDLYVWLSFRLEDSFPDRELAASQKAVCGLWVWLGLLSLCVHLACNPSLIFHLQFVGWSRNSWKDSGGRSSQKQESYHHVLTLVFCYPKKRGNMYEMILILYWW